ncbi:hypothetical protein Tb927.8.4300 [Trypanosoma brucei brucei TREU927]|uniref:Uncharacterized protein n=1 Tax=Trypanosoma brucei brucei (strain 927/4 GUTat10.1) TaxID=185431 RepID=Q57W05_TRYB2|nr:hypothetical protein Tb927.8.4300 [Trypanosoma brucei brucei TREU927]AAX70214.1 hypothetical protein Tb927.8.4300 [Trypanosoma brucei]AAZ13195.1 hypothetical protein Tb927.8.4300 [Trypanosoma brucei brucei TREU927]
MNIHIYIYILLMPYTCLFICVFVCFGYIDRRKRGREFILQKKRKGRRDHVKKDLRRLYCLHAQMNIEAIFFFCFFFMSRFLPCFLLSVCSIGCDDKKGGRVLVASIPFYPTVSFISHLEVLFSFFFQEIGDYLTYLRFFFRPMTQNKIMNMCRVLPTRGTWKYERNWRGKSKIKRKQICFWVEFCCMKLFIFF